MLSYPPVLHVHVLYALGAQKKGTQKYRLIETVRFWFVLVPTTYNWLRNKKTIFDYALLTNGHTCTYWHVHVCSFGYSGYPDQQNVQKPCYTVI